MSRVILMYLSASSVWIIENRYYDYMFYLFSLSFRIFFNTLFDMNAVPSLE